MVTRTMAVIALSTASPLLAAVSSYEADSLPDQSGEWDVLQIYCDPDLWIADCDPDPSVEDRCFYQYVELCEGDDPPGGQTAVYARLLDDFIVDADRFFIEWVVETTATQDDMYWGGGAAIGTGNTYGVRYTFIIARDHAKLNRDNSLPIAHADFQADAPHTHRLELYGADLYIWYIDGEIVDQGVPEGAYPSINPEINFRAKAAWEENTTIWRYFRLGRIAQDGSGNFDDNYDDDDNAVVDSTDFYYFDECFRRDAEGDPGAWPGCAFADFDFDGVIDCDDWYGGDGFDGFRTVWTEPGSPPSFAPCRPDVRAKVDRRKGALGPAPSDRE